MKIDINIKLIPHPGAPEPRVPGYATAGSAAFDLRAAIAAPIVLQPGARELIPTGVALGIGDPGCVGIIAARSGLGIKQGLTLANGVGVIDSDYTGEIHVGLRNISDAPQVIEPDMRVAQMLIIPVARAAFTVVDELAGTERGSGGFGSSGTM